MAKRKFAPTPVTLNEGIPFETACEAWFWYVRCQVARDEGARFVANCGTETRPCEPDDIFCAALQLIRGGKLKNRHLRVLMAYGLREFAPDPRCSEEVEHYKLWDDAMDRLTTVLRAKGIVAVARDDSK